MKKKPKPRKRAPGGGRKSNAERFGEPTVEIHVRLPKSQVDLLDSLGPDRTTALVGIVRTSVQYRLEYGSEPSHCSDCGRPFDQVGGGTCATCD